MATSFNATLAGAQNGVSATPDNRRALMLKVFSGEVLQAFQRSSVSLDRHMVRTIASGRSAQFPVTGRALTSDIESHVPGQDVTANVVNANEEIIQIDDLLSYSSFFDDLDEAMSHYDYRGAVSRQHGEVMARDWDFKVFTAAILGARATNVITELPGGTEIIEAAFSTDANAAVDAIYDAAAALQNNDVVDLENVTCFMNYVDYYNIIRNSDKIINKDFTDTMNGGIDSGVVKMIGGIKVIPTNNIPSVNVTGTFQSRYDVNATTTKAVLFHKDAVGTAQLVGMRTEAQRKTEKVGDIVVTSVARGTKYLRPESCVEIKTA